MGLKMLLMNSNNPTFMFPTIRSPSLQHTLIHQRLKTPSLTSFRTHGLLPCMAMQVNLEGKDNDCEGFLYGSGGNGGAGRAYRGDREWDYHEINDEGVDSYYKSMIELNPNNALILGNYAKYLKEVRGDFTKAKEYCSRSILANGTDGNILSMYADLIWKTQNDVTSAQSYFEQAIEASPNDCHVLASYARFLWDTE